MRRIPLRSASLAATIVLLGLSAGCEQPKPDTSVSQAWSDLRRGEAGAAAESQPGEPTSGPPAGAGPIAAADPPGAAPAANPTPAAQFTTAATRKPEPIAFVNGKPIDREAVVSILIEGHGLGVLQQVVALEVVRQAAEKRGIRIREVDIDNEYDYTIYSPQLQGDSTALLNPIRKNELIQVWLRRTGVSASELRLAMVRQAYLRKMAADRVTVSEDAVRAEYERQCGEKVVVRHIQLAALRDYDQLRARIDAGDDFSALAARFSINEATARDGGLLPPFSIGDLRVPKTLREAAFQLKVGQTSDPIAFEGHYHILRVEQRIPRCGQTLDAMRDQLIRNIRNRQTADQMDQISLDLQSQSRLKITDKALRERYDAARAAGRVVGPALDR